jgi:hypothetical protein
MRREGAKDFQAAREKVRAYHRFRGRAGGAGLYLNLQVAALAQRLGERGARFFRRRPYLPLMRPFRLAAFRVLSVMLGPELSRLHLGPEGPQHARMARLLAEEIPPVTVRTEATLPDNPDRVSQSSSVPITHRASCAMR